MKTLSEFLEIKEGVKFKIQYQDGIIFMIRDNKLWSLGEDLMGTVNTPLNDIIGREITILKDYYLTDTEKEYLKKVIEPYKDKATHICKKFNHICIEHKYEDSDDFKDLVSLDFTEDMQFNNIKAFEHYTLEYLDLEDKIWLN